MPHSDLAENPYVSPAVLADRSGQSDETGKLLYKTFKYTVLTIFVLCALQLLNIVSVFYHHRVENQPLQNPVRVIRNNREELELDDERIITNYWDNDRLAEVMKRTGSDQVEVVPSELGPDKVDIVAKDHHFICGIGSPLITIPLIPCRVPRYKRVTVGYGRDCSKPQLTSTP